MDSQVNGKCDSGICMLDAIALSRCRPTAQVVAPGVTFECQDSQLPRETGRGCFVTPVVKEIRGTGFASGWAQLATSPKELGSTIIASHSFHDAPVESRTCNIKFGELQAVASYREEDDGFVVLNFRLDQLSEQQFSQLDHARRSVSRVTLKLPRRVAREVSVIGFDSHSGFVLVAPRK